MGLRFGICNFENCRKLPFEEWIKTDKGYEHSTYLFCREHLMERKK